MGVRLATTGNPCGLEIGERVRYWRKCRIEYVDNIKDIQFGERGPFATTVIGCVKKATGEYLPSRSYVGLGGAGYDPPSFQAKKYFWLYECRDLIYSEPFFVHPADIMIDNVER